MALPQFRATASLYNTTEPYHMIREETESEHNSVQPAEAAVSLIDPNCGPCTCRILDSGFTRYFLCARACKKLAYVDPLGEGVYFYYTRSCSPPWTQ
jgi:hypothetical protein